MIQTYLILQGCPRSSPKPEESTEKDDIVLFLADTVKELTDQIRETLGNQNIQLSFGKVKTVPEENLQAKIKNQVLTIFCPLVKFFNIADPSAGDINNQKVPRGSGGWHGRCGKQLLKKATPGARAMSVFNDHH